MGKIFKTKDNVFINIDYIVSIEENNGNASVYLKNFSDYIVLSHYEFQMLRDEIGLQKICTAQSGYYESEVNGNKIVEWPDVNNNWKISPNVKWSLKRNLSEDDSFFEVLFENESLQYILYNDKEKQLTYKKFSDDSDETETLQTGSFSLCSSYKGNEESYLFEVTDLVDNTASTIDIETEENI